MVLTAGKLENSNALTTIMVKLTVEPANNDGIKFSKLIFTAINDSINLSV